MALSEAQSLANYGTVAYTGWGETEAAADWTATGGAKAQTGGGGGGGARTTAAPDLSQVPQVLPFVEKQFGTEDVALNELVAQMRAQEKPLDIYTRLETEAGVPQLRAAQTSLSKEVVNLEDVLQGIEPQVAARTRESLITEAQREGLVQAKKEPFWEKLARISTALGRVSGRISEALQGISTKTELALRGQEMALEIPKFKYQVLVERNSRLLSAFSLDREAELESLYAKWNRENQLSDMEWQRANELSDYERQYGDTLRQAAAAAGVVLTGGEGNDQILEMLGVEVARQIGVSEAQAGRGTAGERAQGAARQRLQSDVSSGARFDHLVAIYRDELPVSEIRAAYNAGPMAKQFGPASESPERLEQLVSGNFPETNEVDIDQSLYQFYLSQGYDEATARWLATK